MTTRLASDRDGDQEQDRCDGKLALAGSARRARCVRIGDILAVRRGLVRRTSLGRGAVRAPLDGADRSRRSARAVLVGLLDQPQVDERLRLAHAVDGPESVGQEGQQRLVVLADGLDEQVVRARR